MSILNLHDITIYDAGQGQNAAVRGGGVRIRFVFLYGETQIFILHPQHIPICVSVHRVSQMSILNLNDITIYDAGQGQNAAVRGGGVRGVRCRYVFLYVESDVHPQPPRHHHL